MGLELTLKLSKFSQPFFYTVKILAKIFHQFRVMKIAVTEQDFLMKSDRKHQGQLIFSMASFNSPQLKSYIAENFPALAPISADRHGLRTR